MSLDKRSLTELRSIAQAMGMVSRWDVSKEKLMEQIHEHVREKTKQPDPPIKIDITNTPSNRMLAPEEVEKALEGFFPLGLKLTFPDGNTWEIYCNKRRDSGSMAIPLWNVIQCAKELVRP